MDDRREPGATPPVRCSSHRTPAAGHPARSTTPGVVGGAVGTTSEARGIGVPLNMRNDAGAGCRCARHKVGARRRGLFATPLRYITPRASSDGPARSSQRRSERAQRGPSTTERRSNPCAEALVGVGPRAPRRRCGPAPIGARRRAHRSAQGERMRGRSLRLEHRVNATSAPPRPLGSPQQGD